MRADGLAAGGEILPAVPLPRRRLRVVRNRFDDALRIGDAITRSTEIADISVGGEGDDAVVSAIVRDTISSPRGVAVVEELDYLFLGSSVQSTEPPPLPGKKPVWRQVIDPNPVLLFRFSAVKFNSHRIHYDRDYATKVEGFPGLVVPGTLMAPLFIEMCRRELPQATLTNFHYERTSRPLFDTAPFTIAGAPATDGRSADMWATGPDGSVGFTATATFAG
jgi:3-methylfumaryl-CoA hydratase